MRRVQRQQAARLNLGCCVEYHILDRLLVGERRSECHAVVCPIAHKIKRGLRLAQPAHAMENSSGAKPLLGNQESISTAAQQILGGYLNAIVDDLAMTTSHAQHGRLSHDAITRSVGGHNYHTERLVWNGVGL